MLLQLRDFIAREQQVSTEQLMRAFQISPSALEPMLEKLTTIGWIERVEDPQCYRSCRGCKGTFSYYRWNYPMIEDALINTK